MSEHFAMENWHAQVRVLKQLPEGVDSRRILTSMNAFHLFLTMIENEHLFGVVCRYLDFALEHDADEEEMSDSESVSSAGSAPSSPQDADGYLSSIDPTFPATSFPSLPPEISLQVIKDLTLAEQVMLGQTSRSASHLVAEALQIAATRVLSKFGIRFTEFRLMQTATAAVVSGSAVTALAHSGPTFEPVDLDIITGRGDGSPVVAFFLLAADYGISKNPAQYNFAAGIGRMWTLQRQSTLQVIHVMESLTSEPWDAIGHFHSTAVVGSWSADDIRQGFASLTVNRASITTHSHLALGNTLKEQQKAWSILHKYMDRGFSISINEFDQAHICGQDLSCPATLRSTDDGGCLVSKFPRWIYTADLAPVRETCWSMGGPGCSQGVLSRTGRPTLPFTNYKDTQWAQGIERLITKSDMPTIPVAYVDM